MMTTEDYMIVMEAGKARLTVDLNAGARLASLNIDGYELLVPNNGDILRWGAYPMAPWSGRTRDAAFTFEGQEYQLPQTMPPHAIHGTTFYRPWTMVSEGRFQRDLSQEWPWAGRAVQIFDLQESHLTLRLEVHSDAHPFPASAGYHPWFQRQLKSGQAIQLHFDAKYMYERDANDLPTGQLIPPPKGPWDDGFREVKQPVTLEWPGAMKLHMTSNCDHWVVYSEPENAICVEPTTGPPDALNIAQHLVTPDQPLVLETTWTWEEL